MVARTGGLFDRTAEVQDRLLQPPGEEARLALAPTHHLPPPESSDLDPTAPAAPLTGASAGARATPAPCRGSLRAVQATFPWLRDLSLSGVWRVLQRSGLRLRSTRVQQYSPDLEYAAKQARLLACLRAVAQHPDEVALVFLDAMRYYCWPDAAATWAPVAPAPSSVAERAGPNNQQWRVIGALNALTGRVDDRENYIVGRQQVSEF